VILSTAMPALSTVLTGFATKLTDLENYETSDGEVIGPSYCAC